MEMASSALRFLLGDKSRSIGSPILQTKEDLRKGRKMSFKPERLELGECLGCDRERGRKCKYGRQKYFCSKGKLIRLKLT